MSRTEPAAEDRTPRCSVCKKDLSSVLDAIPEIGTVFCWECGVLDMAAEEAKDA